ncbi:uncharacterized protein [Palaemon carinicauda]|uniref:uncharacterized protein n=1 Tax=Palaemon carinicauda TaxID=392227 RepID=UPI0035B5C1DC
MIRNDVAKALGLKGKCVRLAVTKLGDKTVTYSSKEYDLVLTDKDGNDVNVTAHGIDDITSQIVKETVAENLQLRESKFGMCVYGSHLDIVTLSVFRSNPGISVNHVSSTISDYDISVEPWVSYFCELFGTETLHFERNVKPTSAKGLPLLVIFSDSSTNAYGAVAYARWELESGAFESRLIVAKSRIAPSRQLSIPRLELCGAVLVCRMRKAIEDEITYKFSSLSIHGKYGPEFMALPLEVWPISQSVNCELPDRIHVNLAQYSVHEETIIDASRFNNYDMLIAVTARIFNIVKVNSFKGVLKKLEPGSLQEAERFWIMQAQKSLPENCEKLFQRLGPFQAEDVLYISYLHRVDHAGVDVTLCKLQSKFWVPSARKIIRSIKRGCTLCRKLDAKVEGQRMGQISDERMSPCPAVYHTAVDIFGHFQIKDNVKKRTTGKAYGVIFNCIITRAVYIDVVDGYDTYSFLKCFRRFTAVHGYPDTVHSDLGSQLVSASRELKNDINNWNIHEITEFGAKEGLKWKFNRSADAVWQNGVSEALIKSVKRSLSMLIGTTILTFSDLQTTFFEIANLMNERPIGLKPGMDVELGTYLCPNNLLLGRASNKVPSGSWSHQVTPRKG